MGLLRLGIVCKVEVSGAGRTLSLIFFAILASRASSAEFMPTHPTLLKVVNRALTRRDNYVEKPITNTRALERNQILLGLIARSRKKETHLGVMRACVGRKGGPRLRSRASSCGASQAHGHRPVAQGEARKARAQSLRCQCRVGGVRLHLKPLAIRRVGSMVDRSDARSPAKRLPRRELTLSWIGRPWVLRSSLRVEKDSRTDRQM